MIFTILIPIHNRLPITRQGLIALYNALNYYESNGSSTCRFQVVVIDDGSTDGSSAWIAENYKQVHLVMGNGDLWWSGGINKGADYSLNTLNADYLILWNDDIAPALDYFLKVESAFANNNLADTVVGSKIIAQATGKIWSIGGYFNKTWGRYGMYNDPGTQPKQFFECDWLPGMGTIVPVSALKSKGLYWDDVRFPQYHGDSDFTLRCKAQGYTIKTCLDLVIYNGSDNSNPGRNNLRTLWNSMVSTRSNYNFKKRLIFYRQHGMRPFFYWGLASTYVLYIGSFFKRKVFKLY